MSILIYTVHTLARKFDAVHSTTTISSRQMPSVRLATPASPETLVVSTRPAREAYAEEA